MEAHVRKAILETQTKTGWRVTFLQDNRGNSYINTDIKSGKIHIVEGKRIGMVTTETLNLEL